MLYRVSHRTLYRNINTNLGFLSWDLAKLTNQLASGKKVNKPSDDPSGGAAIMSMRTVLADVAQYNKNVALADDWLKTTESVLQSMKDTIQQATILCEQMSTDTYTDQNMDVAADEVSKLFEALVKLGNSRIGDRYIFAGQKTTTQPFSNYLTILDALADTNNSKVFNGSVVTQGDREFNARPDIPPQTQKFVVEITSAGGIYSGGNGYSLSRLTIDPFGDHNSLFFMAKDVPAWQGQSGNGLTILYSSAITQSVTTLSVSGSTITVNLATSAGAIDTTAADIMNLINTHASASAMVTVFLSPGDSGTGRVTPTSAMSLADGYGGAARFRVSQDGGLTWSEPGLFTARDFRGNNFIYNPQLGHASLTTHMLGYGNDLYFVAKNIGTGGNDVRIQFVDSAPGSALSVTLDPLHWNITVHLANSAGTITSTANDVVSAINNDPLISNLMTASLADYREGGNGRVTLMELDNLEGGGANGIIDLGHARLVTDLPYSPPAPNPNIEFTALAHGVSGNNIQITYSSAVAQSFASYSAAVNASGLTVITIHLANSAGSIMSTAQDVVELFTSAYIHNTASALVVASLVDYPDGKTEKLSLLPVNSAECCTRVWSLTGGDDAITDADHGVNVRFINDNTPFGQDRSPLLPGDRFEIEVSYFKGDVNDININANVETQVKTNVTGEEALGATMAQDNILDTLARLEYALRQHDTAKVAAELPKLNQALEKLTSQMSRVGVKLIRNQFIYNVLGNTEANSTERMSRYEDLDYEQAITMLQTTQTAYQAALASTAMVTKLSLVDYIR
ncbi:MAG: flagellar hook-associated protein FlgL [Thermodesulfobacteriota bacterium]